MKSCKLCWGLSALLAALLTGFVGFAGYTFVFGKTAGIADDGRTAIVLRAEERDFILMEMRGLLEAVQAITQGVVDNDMAGVASSAHAVGMAATGGETAALIAKLPLEFKTLGMATHQAFDDLGNEAADMGDPQVVLGRLSGLMENCTSCHAGYRFDVDEANAR